MSCSLMGIHTITWSDWINEPWIGLRPSRIGNIPAGLGTSDKYVLLAQDDQPVLRVDAFSSSEESFAFNAAVVWHGFPVIGWGHRIYLIEINSQAVITHSLNSYFGHLYANHAYLLVASGEPLWPIPPDGSLVWKSELLGIVGVVVNNVADGIIYGSGDCDPPGGWQPSEIRLDSGQLENAT